MSIRRNASRNAVMFRKEGGVITGYKVGKHKRLYTPFSIATHLRFNANFDDVLQEKDMYVNDVLVEESKRLSFLKWVCKMPDLNIELNYYNNEL